MRLAIAYSPKLIARPIRNVCVVVDVLRATSTLVTMFERGARSVIVTPDVEAARAAKRGGRRLCGEQGGLPPADFDHGNSPVEFSTLNLAGQDVVFCTSNGTVALHAAREAPVTLTGSLLNARAVAAAAVRHARELGCGIEIVCAGRAAGDRLALDDTFCAAVLARLMLDHPDGPIIADCDDSAVIALTLTGQAVAAEARPAVDAPPWTDDVPALAAPAFGRSDSGRHLVKLGLGHDLAYCAQFSVSNVVPRLAVIDDEMVLTPEPPSAPGLSPDAG